MERITARTHASFFSKQPARSSRKRLLLSPASVRLTTGMDATGDVCVCKGMRSYAVLAFVCIRMCVCMCVAKVCVQHCGTGLRGPTLRAALGRLSVLQRPPSLCNIASDSLPSLKRISAHTQSPPTLRAQTEVMPGAQPTAAPNCSAQPAAAPLQQRPLEPCISMRIVRTMTRCDWRSTMATADVRRFRVPS